VGEASPAAPPGRTLVIVIRVEPTGVAPAIFREPGVTFAATPRLFNAAVALADTRGAALPYLVEALPQLNPESWRVLPDGRMETTYRLKPNLTWHDGTPLAPEDFVFAWRVYTTPELGASGLLPMSLIEDIRVLNGRTMAIRWDRPYPQANTLEGSGRGGTTVTLVPLPRHVLEEPSRTSAADAFLALPYWSREYVGLGPYRLERWEPGAFIEGVAFAGHALGKPKIERIRLVFAPDPNSALASLLADAIHLSVDASLRFEQASVLLREWGSRGQVLLRPWLWRSIQIQLRPEVSATPALADLRVRRALAYSIDRQTLNDGVLEGKGVIAHTLIPPQMEYSPEVDRAAAKYPYEPARADQLMNEAGFTRRTDGWYASSAGQRFSMDLRVIAGAQNEQELSILGSAWRQLGFDVRESVLPTAQAQDGQTQAMFPSLFNTGGGSGERALAAFRTDGIPRPENRWTGTNRGAWSNAAYDGLAGAFLTTLDQRERVQQIAQMSRILTEELPMLSLYFSLDVLAHVTGLTGPQIVAPDTFTTWNIHEWEFQ
jgi:peptide/nickel transport system substrate-binding protein